MSGTLSEQECRPQKGRCHSHKDVISVLDGKIHLHLLGIKYITFSSTKLCSGEFYRHTLLKLDIAGRDIYISRIE